MPAVLDPKANRRSPADVSNNGSVDSLDDHQLSDPLARVKHTRLHGVLWDPDDLGDLIDRLLVVVDKVNDLTMGGRQRWYLARPLNRCLVAASVQSVIRDATNAGCR